MWLIKTDANGDSLWAKTFGSELGNENGYCVRQTSDGRYITVSTTNGGVVLMRHDACGDTLWAKTFGSGIGYSVHQTDDGGYIITGLSGGNDVWLIKTDANGDSIWTKIFGGDSYDWGNSVQQTADGGYIIIGSTYSFGAGYVDLWLIKTNNNGDTLWTKTFGGSSYEQGESVEQTPDSGYIIAGTTSSFGSGISDAWLIKTDLNGDTLWTRTFGGSDRDFGRSVTHTSDGGYIILGWTRSFGFGAWDVWLIKTDADGDTVWTETFGGSFEDVGHSLQQTSDGGYIIAGATRSFGSGGYDVWLIRVDADIISNIFVNDYQLKQNYPNPFNSITTIDYHLPAENFVELAIYNLLGQRIRTLTNTQRSEGPHQVQWDGRDESGKEVSSGIYFYQLKAGDPFGGSGQSFTETKKMVLLQ